MYPCAYSRAVSAPDQEVLRELTKNANDIAGICLCECHGNATCNKLRRCMHIYIFFLLGNWIQIDSLNFND
jgi:hypothetical protein